MLPTRCPRCKIRVLPSPEGICPGCRKVIPSPVQPVRIAPQTVATECPECQAPLPANAVLCVECGYHLLRGGFLGTAVERSPFSEVNPAAPPLANLQPPDLNPYAAPAILDDQRIVVDYIGEPFVADLTPQAVKWASSIVAEAERFYLVLFFSFCFCRTAWLLLFPWYGYRLYSWYELNRTFCELRNPTPRLSDHYGLAQDFQAAKGRIWAGFIVGAIAFTLAITLLLIAALSR